MSLGLCSMLSYPCISKSVQVIRTSYTPLSWTTRSHNDHVDHRASSKLFADAEHEERTSVALTRTSIHQGTTSEHPNWTGDESIEDAVLRMLVDKYKPLRTGKIRTAEEKMHRAPPQNSCVTSRNDAYVHVRRRTPIFFWPPCSSSRRTDLACSGGPQAVAYEVQGTLARNCVDSLWSYSYCWHRIILYKLRAGSCSSRADGRRSHTSQRARGQEAIRNCRTARTGKGVHIGLSSWNHKEHKKRYGYADTSQPRECERVGRARRGAHRGALCSINDYETRSFPFLSSEPNKKDSSAPSRAAGNPLRRVTRSTTHSLLVKSFS